MTVAIFGNEDPREHYLASNESRMAAALQEFDQIIEHSAKQTEELRRVTSRLQVLRETFTALHQHEDAVLSGEQVLLVECQPEGDSR